MARARKNTEPSAQPALQLSLAPTFGAQFLAQHAGQVIADPQVAIVELVANAWDAGADRVSIAWPTASKTLLAVEDNGTGMTAEQFAFRWKMLSYTRTEFQGTAVEFPKGVRHRPRAAFGRNGIGRHAMFCFADEYTVETSCEGKLSSYLVRRGAGLAPFDIEPRRQQAADPDDHGTRIWTNALSVGLTPTDIAELIGSRFVADPDFQILVRVRLDRDGPRREQSRSLDQPEPRAFARQRVRDLGVSVA